RARSRLSARLEPDHRVLNLFERDGGHVLDLHVHPTDAVLAPEVGHDTFHGRLLVVRGNLLRELRPVAGHPERSTDEKRLHTSDGNRRPYYRVPGLLRAGCVRGSRAIRM